MSSILTAEQLENLPPIILEGLDDLIRGKDDIFSDLLVVEKDVEIKGTKAISHTYFIKHNPNTLEIELDKFIKNIMSGILEYAIPRGKLEEASPENNNNSYDKIVLLVEEAKSLFVDLEKTGELGELILFLFAERVLKKPQIVSKMSLKTDGALHVNGADGIHADLDPDTGHLRLYWCESKVYSNVNTAINNCLDDISKYLLGEEEGDDIRLINTYMDIADPMREELIRKYVSTRGEYVSHLTYNAICLVGADFEKYKNIQSKNLHNLHNEINKEINVALPELKNKLKSKLISKKIDNFNMHIFYLPVPDVADFRDRFLKLLGGK